MVKTKDGISEEEARLLLYQWIAYITVTERIKILTKDNIFYSDKSKKLRVINAWGIDTALYYLLCMNHNKVVSEFLEWDNYVFEQYYDACYDYKLGTTEVIAGDFKKIIEDAAEAGERDAMNNWATGLKNTGESKKAIELWQKSANLKHPNAMCNLARQYWTENVKDYERAQILFEEASKSGNEHAYYGLAVMYYQGLGVERDMKKTWEYLEKSINKGDAESRYLFARMCLNNDMQEILPDKVLRGMSYMEQAAMDNYEPAFNFLNSNKLK
jgi:TPR repeat protein